MDLKTYRLQRITQAAKLAGVTGVVASLPANISYLTDGYRSIGQEVLCRSQAFVLLNVESGKHSYIMSVAEIPSILEHEPEAEIYCTGGFRFAGTPGDAFSDKVLALVEQRYPSMEEALAAAIKTVPGDVALDESCVNFDSYQKICGLVQGQAVKAGSDVFMEARRIKHPEEVAGLEKAVEVAEQSLLGALKDFRPGMTEQDIEYRYLKLLAEHGALPLFFVATARRRAAFSDTVNTGLKIREGDMIRFDFGCVLDGYNADIARTAVVGKHDEKIDRYFAAIKAGTDQAIAAIRPGVTAGEIFRIAEDVTKEQGIPHYARHHCGHGIGLECYDLPSIVPGSDVTLEENMVLCIETPYYELGWGGVQAEDTIVVTADGCRYLDKTPDELIQL